ncbi:MAG: dihydroneopterin aldolase [Acidimicrobiia bacterium]|nr:dihydroneopterin aldolase [Acidimicrobiia bacterium]
MSAVLITAGGTAPGVAGDSITLKGLRIEAHHGVLAEERREGQPFVVDVTLWMDLSQAGERDELASTIDYGKLATEIHGRVSGEQWNLIERVAERVAELVLEDGRVRRVAVTVHKPRAPIEVEFEDVSVTVVRPLPGAELSAE